MNLNPLRYVVAVAEARSFTQAARLLYVSQPTLSQSIQAQEKSLGIQIFDRRTIPFTLTYAGKLYVEWAQSVLLTESQIRRQIEECATEDISKLSVGIAPHRSSLMLPDILETLVDEFPNCRISVEVGPVADLYKALNNKDLDVIVTDAPNDPLAYSCIFVQSERMLLAVPKNYNMQGHIPDAPGDYQRLSLQELSRYPFITLKPNTYLGSSLRTLCELENFSPIYGIEASTVELAIELASRDLGVTVVPELIVALGRVRHNLDFFTIDKFNPSRKLTIVYPKSGCLTDPAQRFIELFKERFGSTEEQT